MMERGGIADAIEVFNGGNSSQEENDMALAYAQKHNMPMTGGSDAHMWMRLRAGISPWKRRPKAMRSCAKPSAQARPS